MKKLIIILFVFITYVLGGLAQSMSVNGNWAPNITSTSIVEAGLDYPNASVESAPSQTLISVSSYFNIGRRINVSYVSNTLPQEITLEVKRTGNGNIVFGGSINGGEQYLLLAPGGVGREFFNLRTLRAVNNIPIQYRISGISVLRPAATHTITVTYTVTDTIPLSV